MIHLASSYSMSVQHSSTTSNTRDNVMSTLYEGPESPTALTPASTFPNKQNDTNNKPDTATVETTIDKKQDNITPENKNPNAKKKDTVNDDLQREAQNKSCFGMFCCC